VQSTLEYHVYFIIQRTGVPAEAVEKEGRIVLRLTLAYILLYQREAASAGTWS
jgi:hypothetical protein